MLKNTKFHKAFFVVLLSILLYSSFNINFGSNTQLSQPLSVELSSKILTRDNNLQLMAVSGNKSWGSFAADVTNELAGYIPAGKYQKVYNSVYLIITKGWQVFSNDWMGLAWTVVDVITALIPGALPAQIFFSIAKLTPNF